MDQAAPPRQRFELAAAVAVTAAGVGGMGVLGWFGQAWTPERALACAAAGALAGGLLQGGAVIDRLFSAVSFLVGGLTFAAASAWYASGRLAFLKLDLVVPFLIAAVPFGLSRWAFRGLAAPWSGRHTLALAAAVAFCGVAGGSAFLPPSSGETLSGEEARILPFEIGRDGKTITHGGATLREPEVLEIVKRLAKTHPGLKVRVRLPRGVDARAAAAVVIGAAMAQDLEVFTMEEQ